jgi:hypothetical protein
MDPGDAGVAQHDVRLLAMPDSEGTRFQRDYPPAVGACDHAELGEIGASLRRKHRLKLDHHAIAEPDLVQTQIGGSNVAGDVQVRVRGSAR